MIQAFFGYLRDDVWPKVSDASTRWFHALYDDPLMHAVTLVTGAVIAQVVRVLW